MNKTGFLALTAVTAALIVGAVTFRPDATTVTPAEGARFFPSLEPKTVNAVDRVVITAKGESFTLERKNDRWLAKEKGGYPAKFSKIKEVLFSLAQLKRFERKTSDKTRYHKLNLEEPTKKGASSKRLTAFVGERMVADVIVGKSNAKELLFGRSLVYIRVPGDKQAWLAVGDPKLSADVGDWMDRSLFDVKAERVKEVVQSDVNDVRIIVGRDKATDTDFKLRNKPEGSEIKGSRFLQYIGEGLSNLLLEDVQPAADEDLENHAAGRAVFRTFDGLVVTVMLAQTGNKNEEKFWLTFDADVDEKALLKDRPKTSGPLKSAEDVRKEANAINDKTRGWAFQVSSTVTRFMRYNMDDLLESASKKENGDEESPAKKE